jgi:serine/threonine-protein kinase
MTQCRECGREIAENVEFCPICGTVQATIAPANVSDGDSSAIGENGLERPVPEELPVADIFGDAGTAPDAPEIDEVNAGDNPEPNVESAEDGVPAVIGGTAKALGGETNGKKAGLKPLTEGTLLNGRYRIAGKIGGGGMGAVYLAHDQNLGGVERAVKEMVQSSIEAEQQKKAIDDFKRESTILSTLDHPSIPTIYDFFFDECGGRFYLVMKYISGGDLAARLRASSGGRIDERTVVEWAMQITDVLAYLHSLPTTVVYRDLKPSNVMIDGNTGRIMLIDFGIARSINQSQEKGVTAVGTMGYAPPELFSGQVEPRSDIYSLGSTMFHLLTGADPQNNPLLIFDFQKNPRPRQINPQLSDQMERILMRSVEYNPDSRFSSADEMKHVLGEHLENLKAGNITFGISEAPVSISLANQSVFCGFCGQRIVATDLFCAFCGSKQPIAQQGVHAEIYPRSAVTAKLVIDGTGELDTPVFALEKNENLVGRRDPQSNIFPEVDLSKYDPQTKISRRHARIWREGGHFLVEDLGSSNGTILIAGASDTVRLQPRQPHALTNGDRLRLGDTTLHFLLG